MPFQDIQPAQQNGRSQFRKNEVNVSLSGDREVIIRIGVELAKKLGWKPGDIIAMGEGFGVDTGFIQMRLAGMGNNGHRLHGNSGDIARGTATTVVLRIRTPMFVRYVMPRETQAPAPVVFQTFGSALTFMVPAWMQPKVTTAPASDLLDTLD